MPCNYLLLSIATAVATNDDLEKIEKWRFYLRRKNLLSKSYGYPSHEELSSTYLYVCKKERYLLIIYDEIMARISIASASRK